MIKKIRLTNDDEVDPFLEGGTPKAAAKPSKAAKGDPAPAPEPAEPATTDSDDESVQESTRSSDDESVAETVKSARSSTLTIDMLAGDPLFVVLSHFLTCSNRDGHDENIVTVLKKISNSLEKIAAASK